MCFQLFLFLFQFFGFSMTLSGNIHTSQTKKMYAGAIYGSFSLFFFDHQNKKLIKNIFVNFWLYQKGKTRVFQFFPYYFL